MFNFIQVWYTEDPNIANLIKKELKELLIRDGVKNYHRNHREIKQLS